MIEVNVNGEAISPEFIDAISQTIVSFDLVLLRSGEQVTGDIKQAKLTLGAGFQSNTETANLTLGNAYTSFLELSIYETDIQAGDELEILVGVDTGGAFEYVSVARVDVVNVSTFQYLSTVTAYGMIASRFGGECNISGTVKASELADYLTDQTGVPVKLGAFISTSQTIVLDEGITHREALEALALWLGGFAAETGWGVLVAPFSSTPNYQLPDFMTSAPQIEGANYVVDGLVVTDGDGNEYTYGTGRLKVFEPFMTQGAADVLWGNIENYIYRPATVPLAIIDPRLTPFDVMEFDLDGETYVVPSHGISVTYDGGYFGTITVAGLSIEMEEVVTEGPTTKKITFIEKAATQAVAVAKSVNQYFWHNASGAHVTDEIQEDYLYAEADGFSDYQPDASQADYKPYYSVLLNSLGMLFRSAGNYIASFTQSAVAFFDGLGNEETNIVAQFGRNLARIGKEADAHVDLTSTGMDLYDSTGTSAAQFLASGTARLGKPEAYNLQLRTDGLYLYNNNTDLANFKAASLSLNSGKLTLASAAGTKLQDGALSVVTSADSTALFNAGGIVGINSNSEFVAGYKITSGDTYSGSGIAVGNNWARVFTNGSGWAISSNTLQWQSALYSPGGGASKIDATSQPTGTIIAGQVYLSYDASNNLVGISSRQDNSNRIYGMLETGRYYNNAWVWNNIAVGVNASGARYYSVSDATAFRNAIGASSGVWPIATIPTVTIAKGGTGQTTANAGARALGLAKTVNDTLAISNMYCHGLMVNATVIDFTIPTRFLYYGITSANCTISGNIKIRQNNRYLVGSTSSVYIVAATNKNLTASGSGTVGTYAVSNVQASGHITVRITCAASQANAIQSDPVDVWLQNVTITFK